MRISVLVLSSIISCFGPIPAIAAWTTWRLSAAFATSTKARNTMFRRRRRRYASGTNMTASGRRAPRFLVPDLRNGNGHWMEGR